MDTLLAKALPATRQLTYFTRCEPNDTDNCLTLGMKSQACHAGIADNTHIHTNSVHYDNHNLMD